MKQVIYGALLLILGLLPASAQQSRELTQLLERAETSLYGSGMAQVEFVTRLQDRAGKPQGTTKGRMYLQGDAFRLEYGSITAVYSSGTLSYYDKAEETLTHSRPTEEELLQINPLRFLRSRAQGFTSIQLPAPAATTLVRFVPKGKSNIRSVEASFQTKSGSPTRLVFVARDGSRLTAELGAPSHRNAAAASFYVLSERSYPGCEVIDLR